MYWVGGDQLLQTLARWFLKSKASESVVRTMKEEKVPSWNGNINCKPRVIRRVPQNEKYMVLRWKTGNFKR